MDITKMFATESERIFLAEVSPTFAGLEGELPPEERAWVIIRQATTEENTKRSAMFAKRETKYEAGPDGRVGSISDVYYDNSLNRKMHEVFWTLKDVGNLTLGDKPVFSKVPPKIGSVSEFEKEWGRLPLEVALAIHEAVLVQNPTWRGPASLGE
jgi:hypothetical protein